MMVPARKFDEFVEQQLEKKLQVPEPFREVVRNMLDGPIPLEVQERLLKPITQNPFPGKGRKEK